MEHRFWQRAGAMNEVKHLHPGRVSIFQSFFFSDSLYHSPASDAVAAAHRFLQVSLGQLAVLCVAVQHRAQLQVSPGLDPRRRLELKHCLQTVDTQADLRRTRRAEMFCKAQQGQVPGLGGLCARCHPELPKGKTTQNTAAGTWSSAAADLPGVFCHSQLHESKRQRQARRRTRASGSCFQNKTASVT